MANNISGVVIPVRGIDTPTWAEDFNTSFSAIDSHDHSPGEGIQLSFNVVEFVNSFDCDTIISLNEINFSANASETDRCSIYSDGDELFAIDGFGRNIKITANGKLNLTYISGGGFSGDYVAAGAKVTYQSSLDTYTFTGALSNLSKINCNDLINITQFEFPSTVSIKSLTITGPTPNLVFPTFGVIPNGSVITGHLPTHAAQVLAPYVPIGNGGGTSVFSNLSLYFSSLGPIPAYQYYSVFFQGRVPDAVGELDTLELGNRNNISEEIVHPPTYMTPAIIGGISQAPVLTQISTTHRTPLIRYSDNLQTFSDDSSFWESNMVFSIKWVTPL